MNETVVEYVTVTIGGQLFGLPIAQVQDGCVGCGLCGEVAHAAVLCPSFYRADIVSNPTRWERAKRRMRRALTGFLQDRIERRLAAQTI